MLTTAALLTIVALVHSHDVKVGNNTEGRKIFSEVRHASPTIWRQTETLTINTTDTEIISRVVITDLRPDKDGDVKIIEGGEGQKNVTIELKSPTVLRGYDFQIEVYAVPEKNLDGSESKKGDIPTDPGQVRKQRNPEEFPKNGKPSLDLPETIFEDAKIESSTGKNSPGSITNDTELNEGDTKTADSNTEKVNDDKLNLGSGAVANGDTNNPTAAIPHSKYVPDANSNDHSRHGRDATTKTPEIGNERTTPKENKDLQKSITVRPNDNGFVIHPGIDHSNFSIPELFPTNNASSPNTREEKRNVRDVIKNNGDSKTQSQPINEQSKTVEHADFSTSTTAKSVTETRTQQPRINVHFPRRSHDPVPYPIQRTSSAATTTEKSQIKRETELKSTKTTQHEEKDDNVKNIPRFLGEQNSTYSAQKNL